MDDELLKPSREYLAQLGAQIATLEAETHEKIKRYGQDRAKSLWSAFHMAVEPLRREQEALLKVMTDYSIKDCQLNEPIDRRAQIITNRATS